MKRQKTRKSKATTFDDVIPGLAQAGAGYVFTRIAEDSRREESGKALSKINQAERDIATIQELLAEDLRDTESSWRRKRLITQARRQQKRIMDKLGPLQARVSPSRGVNFMDFINKVQMDVERKEAREFARQSAKTAKAQEEYFKQQTQNQKDFKKSYDDFVKSQQSAQSSASAADNARDITKDIKVLD